MSGGRHVHEAFTVTKSGGPGFGFPAPKCSMTVSEPRWPAGIRSDTSIVDLGLAGCQDIYLSSGICSGFLDTARRSHSIQSGQGASRPSGHSHRHFTRTHSRHHGRPDGIATTEHRFNPPFCSGASFPGTAPILPPEDLRFPLRPFQGRSEYKRKPTPAFPLPCAQLQFSVSGASRDRSRHRFCS